MLREVEQVRLQEVGEYEAMAPDGRPEAEKDTGWEAPTIRLAVTVLETELP